MAFTTTTGAGGTSLIGTSGVDTTTITPSALTTAGVFIQAEGDNDVINTLGGGATATNYRVLLGAGNDLLNVASALTTSTIQGGDGVDTVTLTGNVTSSTISGLNGADVLTVSANLTSSLVNGNSDADVITVNGAAGTVSSSTVAGGQGSDTINLSNFTFSSGRVNGQDGDDVINITANLAVAMASGASINGGQGNDIISATADLTNRVILSGDDGNDALTGGNAGDSIYGGEGADTLTADFNAGTAVSDTLVGGAGNDTFRALTVAALNPIAGTSAAATGSGSSLNNMAAIVSNGTIGNTGAFDVITDFTAGAGGDRVDLTGTNFTLISNAIGAGSLVLTGGINYVFALSGTYNATSGVFTYATTNTTGPDTILVQYSSSAAGGTGAASLDSVVLTGVNASQITSANFV